MSKETGRYNAPIVPWRHSLRKNVAFVVLVVVCMTFQLDWTALRSHAQVVTAPADEWQDNIWPIRSQEPWDISTDFPYTRSLEYDVTEGTWLRLDVHPISGDIVFDMIGDLYCLPAGASNTRAIPILLGAPHDADPHFSPDGTQLVFRSDAGLGVDNIWVTDWTSCESMDIRPSQAPEDSPLYDALTSKHEDETLLASSVQETDARRSNRLIREGRSTARRVTNETFRYVSDARFHPSGSSVIATKWYTSSRSLGAGEGWEYDVPGSGSMNGTRLVGRTLPAGWTAQQYGDVQIGPEQLIWRGSDSIIYSQNVRDPTTFAYSKDVHTGIYSIFSHNVTTGQTERLVDASPGGASRPELSRDGRTLAFVRRQRDHEILVLKNLETGSIHNVWDGLTYDETIISAPMGTYPSFAFAPDDSAVVIWAAGKIWTVPLSINSRGERIAGGTPAPIEFTAHVEKRLADLRTVEDGFDLVGLESADTQRVTAFRNLRVDNTGEKVVFTAAGQTVVQVVGNASITEVPVLHPGEAYYSPSFVDDPAGQTFIIHARWSDTNFSSLEIAAVDEGVDSVVELSGLPFGRYTSPILSWRSGKIAVIKLGGDHLSGDIVATAGAGLYVGKVDSDTESTSVEDLQFIATDINTRDRIQMRFLDAQGNQLLVQQSQRSFIIDLAGERDISGVPPHTTVASGRMSTDTAVTFTASSFWRRQEVANIAFVEFYHVYLVSGANVAEGEELWSKPGNSTQGLARLSLDGGHDLSWSLDGKKLFWFLGPYLHSLEVSKLSSCSSEIQEDPVTFGINCVKNLLEFQEVIVEHLTDIARLKDEAPGETLVVSNATLLTMATGGLEQDLIREGTLVIRDGVIVSAGPADSVDIPAVATTIDAQGGFVVPGFIDMHAHWGGMSNPVPAKSWEMQTFLAYGVTTVMNPSADTVDTYAERSRIERGLSLGPRVFQTGSVIYGAGSTELHASVPDMDEARSTLIRIKAEGGRATTSYKNYNLPIRASRQRLLLEARNLSMLCFPEGGMSYDWNIAYIIDGMTTIEHSVPVPVLHEDVRTLYALSGTGATPTHLVNYGGALGEDYVWANYDLPNDPKLQRFTRQDALAEITESTARPSHSYAVWNTSASIAKMVDLGLKTHIGPHGEPPLGHNYHEEMFFTQVGGLSNYQTLQAATSWAASTLGMESSIGSLAPGRLADFLIYPPGVDILEGPIRNTLQLSRVARGGRIWDASTMDEVWPREGRRQEMPPINP